MRDHIVPYNLGHRSDFEHLPSVREVESHMRMGLSGKQRQKECGPPCTTGELSPGNHRGSVELRLVFYGGTFYKHIFDQQ